MWKKDRQDENLMLEEGGILKYLTSVQEKTARKM